MAARERKYYERIKALAGINGLPEALNDDEAISLGQLFELLGDFVEKEENKGLSTNDFTTAFKNALQSYIDSGGVPNNVILRTPFTPDLQTGNAALQGYFRIFGGIFFDENWLRGIWPHNNGNCYLTNTGGWLFEIGGSVRYAVTATGIFRDADGQRAIFNGDTNVAFGRLNLSELFLSDVASNLIGAFDIAAIDQNNRVTRLVEIPASKISPDIERKGKLVMTYFGTPTRTLTDPGNYQNVTAGTQYLLEDLADAINKSWTIFNNSNGPSTVETGDGASNIWFNGVQVDLISIPERCTITIYAYEHEFVVTSFTGTGW
ncbi:MAG: hypothetical protein AAGB30_10935 [Pedobacter sp.]